MQAAVVIEEYKLSVFEGYLTEAGFSYRNAGQLDQKAGVIVLQVQFDQMELQLLSDTVKKANKATSHSGGYLQ